MIRRRKFLWLLAGLTFALIVIGFISTWKKNTSEVPVYTHAAARMLDGEAVYRPGENKPFTYPPFFAVPFMPLARLPEKLARSIFYLINVAALFAILHLLARLLRPQLRSARRQGRGPAAWLFWLTIGLLSARHIAAVFSNQSHDLLILAAITLMLADVARRKELRAGAWSGSAAACKATPLLFPVIFLWQRRWRALSSSLLLLALLTLLPDLIAPQANGQLWVMSWYEAFVAKLEIGQAAEASGAWARWNVLNQSLSGSLWRLSMPPEMQSPHHFDVRLWSPSREIVEWLTLAIQALIVGLMFFVTRPALTKDCPSHELSFRRLG